MPWGSTFGSRTSISSVGGTGGRSQWVSQNDAIFCSAEGGGVVDWARDIRSEYLTGTATTITVVLLILLVSPKVGAGGVLRRCPVCDHVLLSRGKYCGERGSKV